MLSILENIEVKLRWTSSRKLSPMYIHPWIIPHLLKGYFYWNPTFLEQGLANFLCKEPKSKYFRISGPYLSLLKIVNPVV